MSKNIHYPENNIKNRNNQPVIVRIAPSPTGTLHIGTARTALFNFLFAKHNEGRFYLRIEDTDIERSKPEFEKDIIENLRWLGLKWSGRILRQSQRRKVYAKYIKKLLDSGRAFWCYHTKEELEEEKQGQAGRGEAQVHFCEHKHDSRRGQTSANSPRSVLGAAKGVIRLKCPANNIKFHDLIRGEIEFQTSQIGDFVIAKDAQNPLYNLAVVIDDYETKVSHVIRGDDHISNTPKQIIILESLALARPQYAHIPLTLAPDKTKLSKRHGATAIQEYKEIGYLPEALINFMSFLGWNPGGEKEIFTLEELVREFTIEQMQRSAAIFNIEKLDWFNGCHIRQLSLRELTKRCIPYLENAKLIQKEKNEKCKKFKILSTNESISLSWLEKVVRLEQERMKKLSEIGELTGFFFRDELTYELELLRWKDMTKQELKSSIDKLYNILSNVNSRDFVTDKLSAILMPEAEKMKDRGRLLWPLRVSITGLKASPGPFEVLSVLGKERALKRIKDAQMRL